MFQCKEQDKTSEKELNEMEISNVPDKVLKIMVKEMLTELGRIEEHSENLNKERKYKKVSNQTKKYTRGVQEGRTQRGAHQSWMR